MSLRSASVHPRYASHKISYMILNATWRSYPKRFPANLAARSSENRPPLAAKGRPREKKKGGPGCYPRAAALPSARRAQLAQKLALLRKRASRRQTKSAECTEAELESWDKSGLNVDKKYILKC